MADKKRVVATRVDDIDDENIPGAYTPVYYPIGYPDTPKIAGFEFICPCGCGKQGWLGFDNSVKSAWEWNGDEEKPTLHPSVLQRSGCRWHGYLRDGVWVDI